MEAADLEFYFLLLGRDTHGGVRTVRGNYKFTIIAIPECHVPWYNLVGKIAASCSGPNYI